MKKNYHIKYHSQNNYEEPVTEAFFQFMVVPATTEGQVILSEKIKISTGEYFTVKNAFGFNTSRMHTLSTFTKFEITCEFEVVRSMDNKSMKNFNSTSERRALYSKGYIIDNYLFLKPTPLTCLSDKEIIPIIKDNQSVFQFLVKLNSYIGTLIQYVPNTTTVETTATEVLEKGTGVCQDLTHVFIGMARANGIATRYVSGYLNQGSDYLGSSMLHAWAEALIPGMGWIGFDPANNILTDLNHIKVAHGMDYRDCSPIKGVLKTNGKNNTTHQVMVAEQQ